MRRASSAPGIDPNIVPDYLLSVDNPLVVPVGTKVRLLLTSQDVIHAWWVPALAVKKDAIPGFINELWFKVEPDKTGLYRGQCAELCGRDHGFMPIVVDAKQQGRLRAWLESSEAQQPAPADPPQAEPPRTPRIVTKALRTEITHMAHSAHAPAHADHAPPRSAPKASSGAGC